VFVVILADIVVPYVLTKEPSSTYTYPTDESLMFIVELLLAYTSVPVDEFIVDPVSVAEVALITEAFFA
jgi:hypothetical protein